VEPIYSAQELPEIQAYHQPRYVSSCVEYTLTPVLLIVLLRFAVRPLWRVSERAGSRVEGASPVLTRVPTKLWKGPGWAAALIFAVLFFGLYSLFSLPTDVWFGYFHEHAHGQSRTSPAVFILDTLKANTIFMIALGSMVFGLFGLARRTRHWWWLLGISASALMLVSTALDPYRSRVFVDQTSLAPGPLRDRITALMEQAHVEFADVKVDQTASRSVYLQAYFAGTGPTRTIVLNDSLLSGLSEEEVLAAVAHEAGHIHEPRWIGRLGTAIALVLFLGAIEWLFLSSVRRGWFGILERADVRTLPILLLGFAVILMLGTPVSGAVSREREYAADRYAIELTRDPVAFRSMLRKAARTNKMDPNPPRWAVLRGMSHPPIAERIAAVH